MQIKIAPSILAADFSVMGEAIKKLNEAGADVIHCDVMDGTFVGPITFGSQMVKNIRKLTTLPLDAHLMVEHPQTQIKFFAEAGADIITVHFEACKKISPTYLKETLQLIKSYGVKCGVVVNPDTDVENIYDVLPIVDMLVIMSVFPGYGGQKFIPTALEQTQKARAKAREIGRGELDIEIDGGVTTENIKDIIKAGANVIVAGSTVFKAADMSATIKALRG
jgi:ribulose-phosphate 3-epimerase